MPKLRGEAIAVLEDSLRELSCECESLLGESTPKSAPKLTALLDQTPGSPNIEAAIDVYRATPTLTISVPDATAADWRDLRQRLSSEDDHLSKLTIREATTEAKRFLPIIHQVEARFGVTFQANYDGMPTLFWPSTATKDICILAHRVVTLAFLKGDLIVIQCLLWTWPGDVWWVMVVVWCVHWAQHTDRDPHTGLRLDLEGRSHSPMHPSLCAHIDHTKPFFDAELVAAKVENVSLETFLRCCNATVQPWILNRFLAGSPASVAVTILHEIDDDKIGQVEGRLHPLSEPSTKSLRRNGRTAWQVPLRPQSHPHSHR